MHTVWSPDYELANGGLGRDAFSTAGLNFSLVTKFISNGERVVDAVHGNLSIAESTSDPKAFGTWEFDVSQVIGKRESVCVCYVGERERERRHRDVPECGKGL